jgi:neurotransmitter:Na+ symporter, NSS family
MADKNATLESRDGFTSKWGFILACIGSAVGMGNIWRFPILVSAYGGMTFLIPYFIFVILIGSTGIIEEMALGRAAAAGPVGAFGKCTELRTGNKKIGETIGIIPILGSLALAIGYTCVMAWIFKYTFLSFSGGLFAMGQDMNVIGGTFGTTATAWGANLWVVVAIVVSFAIMCMGIAGGIEKANKIMMPVLFGLFICLAIYIATLPGASNGYKYIFTVTPAGLANPKVWIFAFGQAFFSLSVAGNGTVIYGSYLSKSEDIPSSARNVAIFDTLAALLAAFVIIPAMAAGNAELSTGGPGLMFIYLVSVINGMPGGRLVGIVFYICVLFAGVSSIINLYEAPVAFLQEKFKMKRMPATLTIHVFGCAVAMCIQGIVSGWMDVVSIYICPLGALLAGIMFLWVAGKKFALESVNMGANKPIGNWFYPLAKYVYCAAALIALIAGAILGGIG